MGAAKEMKELIRFQIMTLRKKCEDLEENGGEMTEERFLAFMEDIDQKFDYGNREVLKNKTVEDGLTHPFR